MSADRLGRTQAQLAKDYLTNGNIPERLPEIRVPNIILHKRALQSLYLHPATSEAVKGENVHHAYETVMESIKNDLPTLPFWQIVVERMPMLLSSYLQNQLTDTLMRSQKETKSLKFSDMTPHQQALFSVNGKNGETWTFELGPIAFFSDYYGEIAREIHETYPDLSGEEFLDVLSRSGQSITAPPGILDDTTAQHILHTRDPKFHEAIREHTTIDLSGARFHVSSDEKGTIDDPRRIENRCPMSTFGDIKQMFNFYVAVARELYINNYSRKTEEPNEE